MLDDGGPGGGDLDDHRCWRKATELLLDPAAAEARRRLLLLPPAPAELSIERRGVRRRCGARDIWTGLATGKAVRGQVVGRSVAAAKARSRRDGSAQAAASSDAYDCPTTCAGPSFLDE